MQEDNRARQRTGEGNNLQSNPNQNAVVGERYGTHSTVLRVLDKDDAVMLLAIEIHWHAALGVPLAGICG